MDMKKKLPIGIESFEKIRKKGFYYTDKTGLIRDLLQNWGEVNLFTRPRRFGKSLNMDMLKQFFAVDGECGLFDGLEISKETELCEAYMGKFPVISISLKGIHAGTYEAAYQMAAQLIQEEARKQQFLLESGRLTQYDKEAFSKLLKEGMGEGVLCYSLKLMTQLLQKHYGRQVILLIDEYDVPLAKAFEHGYYDKMVLLIRNLLEQVLKTNDSLQFAVLTGCMRISKESIFTGLNNLKVLSVADVRFDEYFGFTDREVKELLEYYGLSSRYGMVKEWYDGYQFGNVEVYCPWDVVNYCELLCAEPDAQPQNYWSNTSSNDAVKQFIQNAGNVSTKREIERLIAGETITKEIHQELTYIDMYRSIDNLWSLLFTTGYLTQRGRPDGNRFHLAIPNMEIRTIFTAQIMELFKETVQKDGETLNRFCEALQNGDAQSVEACFGAYLRNTISIRDTSAKPQMKENFYHGILLGLLGFKDEWDVSSNRESGEGYTDIRIETEEGTGIIIEVKYAHDGNLDAGCQKALEQIGQKQYAQSLYEEGIETILSYGIACYKKRCKVVAANG